MSTWKLSLLANNVDNPESLTYLLKMPLWRNGKRACPGISKNVPLTNCHFQAPISLALENWFSKGSLVLSSDPTVAANYALKDSCLSFSFITCAFCSSPGWPHLSLHMQAHFQIRHFPIVLPKANIDPSFLKSRPYISFTPKKKIWFSCQSDILPLKLTAI